MITAWCSYGDGEDLIGNDVTPLDREHGIKGGE